MLLASDSVRYNLSNIHSTCYGNEFQAGQLREDYLQRVVFAPCIEDLENYNERVFTICNFYIANVFLYNIQVRYKFQSMAGDDDLLNRSNKMALIDGVTDSLRINYTRFIGV